VSERRAPVWIPSARSPPPPTPASDRPRAAHHRHPGGAPHPRSFDRRESEVQDLLVVLGVLALFALVSLIAVGVEKL